MPTSERFVPLDIALLSTGGTIEKTYDPLEGVLRNDVSVLDVLLSELRLEGVRLHRRAVLNMDSMDMTPEDHELIVEAAREASNAYAGVIIVHGTDRLAATGEAIAAAYDPPVPIVLTGAMTPWILRTSDAKQNLTEALTAVQLLSQGVYVCMHNRVIAFPGVVKDCRNLRFVRNSDLQHEEV
ncbi:MAG: asparaginase domain-containing protein [Phycisphaerales bacterium]|jgi:L-asparaginase|nr:asparaginase domain-containing protein [Phycisphaerales bacterium]